MTAPEPADVTSEAITALLRRALEHAEAMAREVREALGEPDAAAAAVAAERACIIALARERNAGYLGRRAGTGALRYESFADLIEGRGDD